MDGSLVDMTVTYSKDGLFTMKSVINTATGKKYNYSFEKTIDGAPSNILLFFVNEGSYIDGLTLGINSISCDDTLVQNGKTYNMQGQLVDDNYQGIVIRNGKKRISK
jgi:arabinan endo-1,5-alpha-L-arabinosidase